MNEQIEQIIHKEIIVAAPLDNMSYKLNCHAHVPQHYVQYVVAGSPFFTCVCFKPGNIMLFTAVFSLIQK